MPDGATELLDPPADEITDAQPAPEQDTTGDVIAADLLVEEISIDGMCGVY
jgi:mycofactocin precursor